jgi:hypothetical protein
MKYRYYFMYSCYNMGVHQNVKDARHKGFMLDDFIHMKYPKHINPQRQKAN